MIKSISLDSSAVATPVNEGISKAKTVAYWVTTGLVVFCMTGGILELASASTTVDGITQLGYPAYIIPALGLGKVLAMLTLLWPGLPRLKEWAYAGIFFNMLGALVSHVAHEDAAWTIVVSVSIAALTLASWALRPQSRRLGELL
ncbi:MAG TPA: DoxX family protein [Polyangiaceae bacterium]|nr:DoxX family protein [Polyangiaceae bacterium]